ncbi:hypothetical protein NS220_03720 [Microbacterium testaceum]|uniref:Uncharacterized protein n=1 Tax=Microbacterium testaceum TaxID=2033 RepID=A0A147EZV2_MICTE|nr:hypothetical protein [Microbacterium testaceum]KTR96061.1 hypothetical protein NS220_03720 [Microbacterium testaceum]
MSGSDDKPDDPEDVTLWAGRLRAWPAAPVPSTARDDGESDGNVDATLIARRRGPGRGPRREDDAPEGEGDIDDTAPGGRPPNDVTVRSSRRGQGPAERVEDSAVETDITVRSVREGGSEKPAEHVLDDTTTAARRVGGPAEPLSATAPGRRRASRAGAHPEGGAETAPREPRVEPTPRGDAPARTVRVPGEETAEAYGPRADEAVRVHRNVPPPRMDPDRDASLVRPKGARRGVAAPLVIGGTTIVVLAGALAAFVLLAR